MTALDALFYRRARLVRILEDLDDEASRLQWWQLLKRREIRLRFHAIVRAVDSLSQKIDHVAEAERVGLSLR